MLKSIAVLSMTIPGLHTGFDERVVQRVVLLSTTCKQGTGIASEGVTPQLVCLRKFEIWQDVLVAPRFQIVLRAPTLKIQRVAPDVNHRVVRR